MNVGDIATRVRRQFGDNFSSRITDNDIYRWINDGMREIANKNELLQVTATVNFVVGDAEYSFPAGMMKLITVTVDGRPIRGMGFKEFLNYTQDSENVVSGEPNTFTLWAGNIVVFPKPQKAGELKVYYVRYPTEIDSNDDVPEIPETYHMRLVEYCLAHAAEFDEDDERYVNKMGEFENNTAILKDDEDWDIRDQYPVISAVPEDYGDNAHYGYQSW